MARHKFGSEFMKKLWSNPAFKKKMLKVRKKQANREENLIRNSNALKKFWANPENKARMIKSRSKCKKYLNRHKKVSKTLKRRYANGEIKVWCDGLTKKDHISLQQISDKLKGKIPDYKKNRFHYVGELGSEVHCILMRSRWEVAFAYWLDKHNIKWKYESKHFYIGEGDWSGVTYTPDFYLLDYNEYVEVKGYSSKEFRRKLKEFNKRYPKEKLTILSGRERFASIIKLVQYV